MMHVLILFCETQAPQTSNGVLRSDMSFGKGSQSSHWQGMVDCLNTLLNTLKESFVPPIIVFKIFSQVFSYINVQHLNSCLSEVLLFRQDTFTLDVMEVPQGSG
ncbi:myosin 2 [Artemisia annua]|uniref:Myosin 2 n=1 Tax=Artemisia annua TaxID=35608 RepID=A0A2U1KAQ8_ARTAN|nr:myosin 2 [Artemisia annua]